MPKLPSVYKRPGSPVYWGSIMIKGQRKQYALTENKAASQRMLAEIKEGRREITKYGNVTWKAFLTKFFEWAKANKSPKTVRRDKTSVEYFEEFKPNIHELAEITPTVLEDFKTWLINMAAEYKSKKKTPYKKGDMGPQTINRTLASIKAMMRKAEDWDLIGQQKWRTIKKIKVAKGRVEFFTADELGVLMAHTASMSAEQPLDKRPPWLTVTFLGSRAGLRRAEIHNLMWSDIDFGRGILSVTPKKDWHPKDYECRDIPMPTDLIKHLQKLPKRGPYVVYDKYGGRLSIDSYTAYYGREVKKCGLTGNVHKLRHTYASHLVQNGVDLYTVSKLMGHSSIKTTEIYAHLSPITFANAIKKLPVIKYCSKNCSKKISRKSH
jgi:integrase